MDDEPVRSADLRQAPETSVARQGPDAGRVPAVERYHHLRAQPLAAGDSTVYEQLRRGISQNDDRAVQAFRNDADEIRVRAEHDMTEALRNPNELRAEVTNVIAKRAGLRRAPFRKIPELERAYFVGLWTVKAYESFLAAVKKDKWDRQRTLYDFVWKICLEAYPNAHKLWRNEGRYVQIPKERCGYLQVPLVEVETHAPWTVQISQEDKFSMRYLLTDEECEIVFRRIWLMDTYQEIADYLNYSVWRKKTNPELNVPDYLDSRARTGKLYSPGLVGRRFRRAMQKLRDVSPPHPDARPEDRSQ